MTDLEICHALNKLPGWKFESTLATNNPSFGAGILTAPEGETITLTFKDGARMSGNLSKVYEKYKSQMDSIG